MDQAVDGRSSLPGKDAWRKLLLPCPIPLLAFAALDWKMSGLFPPVFSGFTLCIEPAGWDAVVDWAEPRGHTLGVAFGARDRWSE